MDGGAWWAADQGVAKSQARLSDFTFSFHFHALEEETTENEMVGWHHQLDTHEFEQALEDGEGQTSLVCCSPWGR